MKFETWLNKQSDPICKVKLKQFLNKKKQSKLLTFLYEETVMADTFSKQFKWVSKEAINKFIGRSIV